MSLAGWHCQGELWERWSLAQVTFAGDICRHRAAEGRSTRPALPQLGFLCSSASFSECGSQAEWETGQILDPGNKSGAVRLGWLTGVFLNAALRVFGVVLCFQLLDCKAAYPAIILCFFLNNRGCLCPSCQGSWRARGVGKCLS